MVDPNPAKEPMLEDGRTALHYASSTGDCSSVAELLASGSVDANARDAVGYSAVQIAAAEGHLDVLRLLLRHNANVNLHDTLVSFCSYLEIGCILLCVYVFVYEHLRRNQSITNIRSVIVKRNISAYHTPPA